MAKYYSAEVEFESEDLITEADEHIPTYTAFFVGFKKYPEDGIEFEIEKIEDEDGNKVPLKSFYPSTLQNVYDLVYEANIKLIEEGPLYDLD